MYFTSQFITKDYKTEGILQDEDNKLSFIKSSYIVKSTNQLKVHKR